LWKCQNFSIFFTKNPKKIKKVINYKDYKGELQ
jgi:hypothetical protein